MYFPSSSLVAVMPSNPLDPTRQGKLKAIAALLNRSLQPKGITVVKAAFKDSCLEILLESAQVPNQQALVAFVSQRVTHLESAAIKKVKLYLRQTGEEFPAWHQEIELVGQSLPLVKPQPTSLELAKQGNVEAIAALMNRSLRPKGIIVAETAFKDGCLQILLESAQVPNQQALVAFVRAGLKRLDAASIQRARIYGRQKGEEMPAWSQEFELVGQPLPVVKPQPTPLQLAKQGNAEAIAALINSSLRPKGTTVIKATFKDSCLQILLEAAQVPNQQVLEAFVHRELIRLGSASIKRARIYGRQKGEEIPAWSQELELVAQPSLIVKPQLTPLELAKQGNVEAITVLMNRSLQPKGITVVKATFKDGCLQILLESAQVPNQQTLAAFVRAGLKRLDAASIQRARIYGRQKDEEIPAWSQELDIDSNSPSPKDVPTTQIQTNNHAENVSAKPFVVNAHRKFWQLPSLARFGVVGIILLVVGLNIFVVFSYNNVNNNSKDAASSNPDEQYRYILNDFIKDQLKNDEDIVKSMNIFQARGGFEASKQRAMKNCKALNEGIIKEKLLQDKSKEVMRVLNYSQPGRRLTEKETQQVNYLYAIYAAEVFAGQDVYCPQTRKDFQINN